MKTTNAKTIEFNRILTELQRDKVTRDAEVISLHEMREEPTEDFRVCVSEGETVEELMKKRANGIFEKQTILALWHSARERLSAMIAKLEDELAHAAEMQKRIDEGKEKHLELRMRSGGGNFPHGI